MASFFQRKIRDPLITLLRQGVTPEKLALSLAFGIVLGCFPVLGTTTALCAAIALLLRLNLPAIQLVNYLVYPLQLLLILPFIRLGELLLRTKSTQLTLSQIQAMTKTNFLDAFHELWLVLLHAVFAWSLFAPFVIFALYTLFHFLLRRMRPSLPPNEPVTKLAEP